MVSIAVQIASHPQPHDESNPLWQGPCGEGWNGGITQSMLVNFLSCRERFRLKYIRGLMPPDKWNHKPGYGNMWHACEEALAREENWTTTLDQHVAQLERQYPIQIDDIHKWHNVCHVQFPEYVKYWADHPDVVNRTPLLQEQVFDVPHPLPSGRVVRLRGKWDSVDLIREESEGLLGRHKMTRDGIWLQENKTKGEIDKLQVERQLKFDLQTMLYLVALSRVPREYLGSEKPILGVRYNVVRRPLSGGRGNITPHKAKATKSKYTPAETAEQFYERLRRDYIAKEPDYWFFRVRAEISESEIEVFKRTCLDPLLDHLCAWYDEVTKQTIELSYAWRPPMNYRTPFGVWSALEEGGATEYDHCLATGSEVGLRRVQELFTELKE